MAILVCGIGYMEFYRGNGVNGDWLTNGGSFPVENGWGGEVCWGGKYVTSFP